MSTDDGTDYNGQDDTKPTVMTIPSNDGWFSEGYKAMRDQAPPNNEIPFGRIIAKSLKRKHLVKALIAADKKIEQLQNELTVARGHDHRYDALKYHLGRSDIDQLCMDFNLVRKEDYLDAISEREFTEQLAAAKPYDTETLRLANVGDCLRQMVERTSIGVVIPGRTLEEVEQGFAQAGIKPNWRPPSGPNYPAMLWQLLSEFTAPSDIFRCGWGWRCASNLGHFEGETLEAIVDNMTAMKEAVK